MSPCITKVIVGFNGRQHEAFTAQLGTEGLVASVTYGVLSGIRNCNNRFEEGAYLTVTFPRNAHRDLMLDGHTYSAQVEKSHWAGAGKFHLSLRFVDMSPLERHRLELSLQEVLGSAA